jgi:hypothetical protein
MRAIFDIQEFNLANSSPDAGDSHTVFGMKLSKSLKFLRVEFCDVLDFPIAQNVDKSRTVVPNSNRSECCHLFKSGAAIGCLVGKSTDNDSRLAGHGNLNKN